MRDDNVAICCSGQFDFYIVWFHFRVVWRGPRKTGAVFWLNYYWSLNKYITYMFYHIAIVKRFTKDTFWGRLDYLIFDILAYSYYDSLTCSLYILLMP